MPIEQHAPEMERIVDSGQAVEELGDGFGGDQGPAEGPLWWKEGGYLLFSDIHNNRRMKWAAGEGMSVFHEPTNRANGLTRDLQGRLLASEHDSRRVTRREPDDSITVVAGSYQGRPLNRPNDVVVKSDGCIYFTDPWTSPAAPTQFDLGFSGVYRVTPDLGTLTLLVGDFVVPNGIAFSPDESVLYVNDSRRGHIRAFDVQPNGTLALATDRVLAELRGERPGVPDGMKVGRRGQHLLRRIRRRVGPGPQRQTPGNHSPRRACHHQRRLRRRRLEDPVHNHPQLGSFHPTEDSRHPRSRRKLETRTFRQRSRFGGIWRTLQPHDG